MSVHIGQEEFDRDRRIFERGRRAATGDDWPLVADEALALALARTLEDVRRELASALVKFAPMASPHEGHSVIREEFEELWEHVKDNTGRTTEARAEAIQVAAMALRYAVDLCEVPS